MNWIAQGLRYLSKLRFRLMGLATIKDIPTDRFRDLIKQLNAAGWHTRSEYAGFDAWIDYGCIKLRKGFVTLKCEWDNWTEGSVEGPRQTVEDIARDRGLTVTYAWRWSDYDRT
jgi:hypothetical protein